MATKFELSNEFNERKYLLVEPSSSHYLTIEIGEFVGTDDAEVIDFDLSRRECIRLIEWMASNVPTSTHKIMPKIVCLCGSTRFWRTFQRVGLEETLAGHIVLSIGAASGTDDEHFGNLPQDEYDRAKSDLDQLHMRKIELADEVIVLNVDGYIGESTRREIEHAKAQHRPIRYLEPLE